MRGFGLKGFPQEWYTRRQGNRGPSPSMWTVPFVPFLTMMLILIWNKNLIKNVNIWCRLTECFSCVCFTYRTELTFWFSTCRLTLSWGGYWEFHFLQPNSSIWHVHLAHSTFSQHRICSSFCQELYRFMSVTEICWVKTCFSLQQHVSQHCFHSLYWRFQAHGSHPVS